MIATGNSLSGARVNVRAKGGGVNSIFLVQLRKLLAQGFAVEICARRKADGWKRRVKWAWKIDEIFFGCERVRRTENCSQRVHRKCRIVRSRERTAFHLANQNRLKGLVGTSAARENLNPHPTRKEANIGGEACTGGEILSGGRPRGLRRICPPCRLQSEH